MKIILFPLCIVLFYSCDKSDCQTCTRTWHYKSYTQLANGNTTSVSEYDGGSETFTACGKDMIEAEEKGKTTYGKVPHPNYAGGFIITEGTGTYNCH